LAIGGSFFHASCSDVAALYLVVHGSLMVANFFLLVLVPNSLLLALVGTANLGVWLWGSVAVFSYHHSLDRSLDSHFGTNCSQVTAVHSSDLSQSLAIPLSPQFPFWVAFVFLLYTWAITLLLALSVFAMCLVFTFYRPDAGLERQDPEKGGPFSDQEDEDDTKTERSTRSDIQEHKVN
jgi:hypothetical protein